MSWNKDVIAAILLTAAKTSLKGWHTLQVFEKTTGRSKEAFTNIDVAVENYLSTALSKYIPDANFVGEESIGTLSNVQEQGIPTDFYAHKAFVVDPIDGTLNYINHLPTWGISIGYIQDNECTEGAIVLPALGEMLISENGTIYHYEIETPVLQLEKVSLEKFTVHPPQGIPACSTTDHCFKRYVSKTSTKCHIVGSCVYSIAKVIKASYLAYIAQINIWDYAGGIGLFRAMNKPVYYLDGHSIQELPWRIDSEHWSKGLKARYPFIFAHSYEDACKLIPSR